MAFVSSTTAVGIAEARNAQANSIHIQINSATFSSDILSQDTTVLATVTALAHVTFTADLTMLAYRAMPDGKTAMIRVALPSNATFNFGSYSLNLADGTPFIVGTWDTLQVKTINQIRYIEQNIVLSTLLPVINLTILNNIDASLPEVSHETDLPIANAAPYSVYYVDSYTAYGNLPALASRFGSSWFYYPSDRNSGVVPGTYNNVTVDARGRVIAASSNTLTVTLIGDATGSGATGSNITLTLKNSGVLAGTYNTVTVNTKGIVTTGSNISWVLKAGDTMSGNLVIASPFVLYSDHFRFISDPANDTGMDYGGSNIINFVNGGINGFTINAAGNPVVNSGHILYSDSIRFLSDPGQNTGIDYGGDGYINFVNQGVVSIQINASGNLAILPGHQIYTDSLRFISDQSSGIQTGGPGALLMVTNNVVHGTLDGAGNITFTGQIIGTSIISRPNINGDKLFYFENAVGAVTGYVQQAIDGSIHINNSATEFILQQDGRINTSHYGFLENYFAQRPTVLGTAPERVGGNCGTLVINSGYEVFDVGDGRHQARYWANNCTNCANCQCACDCSTTCFPPWAKVIMADGSEKTIKDIKVGEFVAGRYGEFNQVLAKEYPPLGNRPMFLVNDEHWTTDEHPHLIKQGFAAIIPDNYFKVDVGGWFPVELADGSFETWQNVGLPDEIFHEFKLGVEACYRGGYKRIDSIITYNWPNDFKLYNLVLAGSHTYHVDGYLVTGWPQTVDFNYNLWQPTHRKHIIPSCIEELV